MFIQLSARPIFSQSLSIFLRAAKNCVDDFGECFAQAGASRAGRAARAKTHAESTSGSRKKSSSLKF